MNHCAPQVGGLLIVQRRGLRRKCVEPQYKLTNSSYDDFYRTCFTEDTVDALWPFNATAASQLPPASLDYKVPWIPGMPVEYDDDKPETIFGDNPTPTPPQAVSIKTSRPLMTGPRLFLSHRPRRVRYSPNAMSHPM